MAGKLTVLDRLAREGRIVPKIGTREIQAGLTLDPLSLPGAMQARDEFRRAGMGRFASMTPERQVYQQGLRSVRGAKIKPLRDAEMGVREDLEGLQRDFEDAYSDAYESWQDELNSNVPDQAPILEYGFESADLNFGTPSSDLRDYWPSYSKTPEWFEDKVNAYDSQLEELGDELEYMRSPEYIQRLQTRSPRYRNYQRAMEARAANERMGHDLSRRYATAVRNLVRRGLSPEEADAYVRRYFGVR